MTAPTGHRDLALLTAGVAVSTAGDAAALTALLLRLHPDGSGWVSALLAAELVPIVVLSPVVGRLVDRIETRRLLLIALTGQAIVAVPLALVRSPAATVMLFAALGALTALVRPATASLVPAITGTAHTARGYSLIATGVSLGWIVGPAAGGLTTAALGTRAALLIDAGTFAVLALACAGLRARRRPRGGLESRTEDGPRSGFRLLWTDQTLRVALSVSALAVGCAVIDNVAAPFRFIDQLGATATGYGLYLTMWGTGALLGAQVLPLAGQHRAETSLAAGNALTGLGIAGIGLAPGLPLALAASVLGGIGNGMCNVGQSALISRRVTPQQTGRAFAASGALIQLAIGAGTACAAPLVHLLQPDGALTAAGALALVTALAALILARRRARAVEPSSIDQAASAVP